MADCPHDEFIIVCYRDGILIRKCKHCNQGEVRTEGWVDYQTVIDVLIIYGK
jgi:hypothetical protein